MKKNNTTKIAEELYEKVEGKYTDFGPDNIISETDKIVTKLSADLKSDRTRYIQGIIFSIIDFLNLCEDKNKHKGDFLEEITCKLKNI